MDNPNNAPDPEEEICVTLELDDGSTEECEILTIFELEDQDYIVLLPLDANGESNEEDSVYIYRYFEDSEGNPSMENITNDEEYEAVEGKFNELLEDL